ncbi:MAG: hypothetical protein HQ518_10430 [Rhodopirellula sp.]|nr:hypothetical protein [Rhodopirellula sp.]
MRTLRFLHSIAFSVGLTVLLCGGVVLLTEKIVIYPHERSLPLLQLNKVEEVGFRALHKLPGLHARQGFTPSDTVGGGMLGAGSLICLLSGGSMWRRAR